VKLKVGGFLHNSLVNGDGIRSVIFVSGCIHNCISCQNEFMKDFNYGDDVSIHDIIQKIKNNIPIIKGVTFSGGEPFESALALSRVSEEIRSLGLNIWCYSGYTYDEIVNSGDSDKLSLLGSIDVLIDGKFDDTLKQGASTYTGSSNQRIIDTVKSISQKNIILWNK
jgi:anaerobic ribonucleoside-triphosphate reductase activating protein